MLIDISQINFGTYIAIILGLGILAQWTAWRYKFPSILLLLGFGFGAQHFFHLSIDNYLSGELGEQLLIPMVGLAVSLILFEGGLTLKFSELEESGAPVLRLCTIGVAVSFSLITAIGIYFFHWNWRIAALLGAILVVTGPTVISPLIRHIKPARNVSSIIKWEGIIVDPIGAILALLIFQAATAGDLESARNVALITITKSLVVGIIFAIILAKAIEYLLKNHLIPDFLHSVFIISVIAIAFTGSNAIVSESGLLTVTVMGIVLANQKSVSVKHILEFKENLSILFISMLFLILSGRIDSTSLKDAAYEGILLLLLLIFLVRPASIFISNLFSSKTTLKERLFLSSLAPRGIVAAAVTSIFALELEHAAKLHDEITPEIISQAHHLIPIVFIVIIGTVAFYGLLASPIANYLGLATKNPRGILFAGASNWLRMLAKALHDDGHIVLMLDTNYANVAAATLEGIPAKRANILSEYVEEELDLTGIGQLIAATPNDEVNSLAAKEFNHIFGSANIWQVAPRDDNAHHSTAVSPMKRSRILFPGRPSHDELALMVNAGAKIKRTSISEQYDFTQFTEDNPGAYILFLDSPEKGLHPASEETKKISTGTSIYALVPA